MEGRVVRVWVIGVLFHCVYMLSVFDIYFRSPIVHGMPPQVALEVNPPAKRLFLFVGDGLRADRFFELLPDGSSRAPFLRSIATTKGAWGVSHTRVPTESRPCHVAMIGGFYEDLSAVTKGWKENPVEFDHVFNESAQAWGWGSPDIIPMFAMKTPHMNCSCYPPDFEDFAGEMSELDDWVFREVSNAFNEAWHNSTLDSLLKQPRSTFFLHLLGLDSLGHAYKPGSAEYLSQISAVDQGIAKICTLIDSYFGDSSTAFLFTADHGMSDKGNHGDGEKANTETPFVVWGAGIRGPIEAEIPDTVTPTEWHLNHLIRRDVEQADLTPLMASTIGVPFPMNSVGVLPVDLLAVSDKDRALLLYANTRQILGQFLVKSEIMEAHTIFFQPFGPLKNFLPLHKREANLEDDIISSIEQEDWVTVQKSSQKLIKLAIEGLNYLQTYDRLFLISVVTIAYLMWIIYIALFVIQNYSELSPYTIHPGVVTHSLFVRTGNPTAWKVGSLSGFLFSSLLLAIQSSPLLYYAYIGFPFYFLSVLGQHWRLLIEGLGGTNIKQLLKTVAILLIVFLAVEVMVVGYYIREVFGLGLVSMGFWPWVSLKAPIFPHIQAGVAGFLPFMWLTGCWVCAVFTFLDPVLVEDVSLVCLGGFCIIVMGFSSLRDWPCFNINKGVSLGEEHLDSWIRGRRSLRSMAFLCFQIFLVALGIWITFDSSHHLKERRGLPPFNQVLAWLVMGLGLFGPSIPSTHYFDLLVRIFLGFAPSFLLLSISYEVVFLAALSFTLVVWIVLETRRRGALSNTVVQKETYYDQAPHSAPLRSSDIITALFYLCFFYAGFFGTGNISSISSFEVASVYRLATVFAPFLMASLLILKLLVPLTLVACAFNVICRIANVNPAGFFFIVIALSDVMSLNFLFLVRDSGSWKDIGMSISHFAIADAFIIFQLLLFGLSQILLTHVVVEHKKDK